VAAGFGQQKKRAENVYPLAQAESRWSTITKAPQYSSGKRIVVAERSASVIIQILVRSRRR
jgi:hypothetical protein